MEKSHRLTDGRIRAAVGDRVEIEVPGKTAQGYVWSVDNDPDFVEVVDHSVEANRESFGGEGTERFVLRPNKTGHGEIRFSLAAPWKDEAAEMHTLTFDIDDP